MRIGEEGRYPLLPHRVGHAVHASGAFRVLIPLLQIRVQYEMIPSSKAGIVTLPPRLAAKLLHLFASVTTLV